MKAVLFLLYAGYRRAGGLKEVTSTACIYVLTAIALAALIAPIAHIVINGVSSLSIDFIVQEPAESGRAGGIGSILISTFLIVAISLVAALPLALGTAVLLSEFMPRSKVVMPVVRNALDVLAGVPSVVFGLFGLAFFCRQLGMGYSILAGGLTLACMILPVLIRTFCNAIESAPPSYKLASASLGVSRTATLWHITLPVALAGLTSGCVLGLTRAFAETAVLLFTSGYSDRMPTSVMDSGRSISVHIYELATNIPGGQNAAYGSALVLLTLLAAISMAIHFASVKLQSKFLGVTLPTWR
ncbi:phosphate ABC transporter permease PstA [Variovorax beijingensis]|uniref:phosphate ABC transporter permease PstA n=1 Tax=Variovorax beijingensis TaxID=2496117 RepID=UPI003F69BD06